MIADRHALLAEWEVFEEDAKPRHCEAEAFDFWGCTRPAGHPGWHAALNPDNEHIYAVWDADDTFTERTEKT